MDKLIKKIWIIMLVLALFLVVSFFIDQQTVLSIQKLRNPILDNIILILSLEKIQFGFIILMVILVAVLFLLIKKKRKIFFPAALATGITFGLVYALKEIVSRVRPDSFFGLNNSINALGSSFPSSHAAIVFVLLPFIWKNYPKLRYVWLVYAIFIAFSRIWFGVHYLSDVIAGAFLGLLIGFLFNIKK